MQDQAIQEPATDTAAGTIDEKDLCAVARAYREQIAFGSGPEAALNLATIVYQQRHPCVPLAVARTRVDAALAK